MKVRLSGFLWGVIGIGLCGNAVSGPTPCVQKEDVRVFFEPARASSDASAMRVLFQWFAEHGWMDVQRRRNRGQSITPPNIRCIFRVISSREASKMLEVSCSEADSWLHHDRGYVRRIRRSFPVTELAEGTVCDFEGFLREHRGDLEGIER